MSSTLRRVNGALARVALTFLVTDAILNTLDLVTTFIGFSRGMPEQNRFPRAFMEFVGNEYAGAILIKVAVYSLILVLYFVIKRTKGNDDQQSGIFVGLLFDNAIVIYVGYYLIGTVLGNFLALGFRY